MKYIGIDPASGKETCVWTGKDYEFIKPQNVRHYINLILEKEPNCLIAWDAPLSFCNSSYSDRVVDKITRKWVKQKVHDGYFEKKSVNALPFSGLSHWVISCEALGFPFGERLNSLCLYEHTTFQNHKGQYLLEVHPAVSMACMWYEKDVKEPFPVYKKTKDSRKLIVDTLGFPEICTENDDILDAYVAYDMAKKFAEKTAISIYPPSKGSYVLPLGKALDELLTV